MTDIVVGTNMFADCDVPIAIDGLPAIQIAIDESDRLRVTVQLDAPPAKRALRVASNVVQIGEATVIETPDSVEVRSAGSTVIAARRVADVVEVDLDLRPFGLFIFSDEQALHVGTSVLSGNTMSGAKTGIALSTGAA